MSSSSVAISAGSVRVERKRAHGRDPALLSRRFTSSRDPIGDIVDKERRVKRFNTRILTSRYGYLELTTCGKIIGAGIEGARSSGKDLQAAQMPNNCINSHYLKLISYKIDLNLELDSSSSSLNRAYKNVTSHTLHDSDKNISDLTLNFFSKMRCNCI